MSMPDTAVPEKCTVLVVGGGPAGSYSAAVLAREGISVVLLEADTFPRYHVGESMLPSMRHFLRFIDLDDKFDAHGFRHKKGAAFRFNWSNPQAYTDFIRTGGPKNYAWNVVRSEADDILFRHAGESGAKVFDATRVDSIDFETSNENSEISSSDLPDLGRPVSAAWSRKDGSSGVVKCDYIIDASGRAGLVSTKYFKNRRYNQGLKNVASWGYWMNSSPYGVGTQQEGSPYFEALNDASGWVWCIPLHNGTTSVGVVMNQASATAKKREMDSPSSKDFYVRSLDLSPGIKELLLNAELVSDVKSASDWSYSASAYASPRVRIAGDAGCFIDPFFSSGVHLAMASGLSAAVTTAASIRGDHDESAAARWHSRKVAESYTRFLVVVLSSLKQIRSKDTPVLNNSDEESFDRAFDLFRPIIQGTADADASKAKLTQSEISKSVDFSFRAFTHVPTEETSALLEKLKLTATDSTDDKISQAALSELEKTLSPTELQILDTIRARQMAQAAKEESEKNADEFGGLDVIDGLAPNLERGNLTLVDAKAKAAAQASEPGASKEPLSHLENTVVDLLVKKGPIGIAQQA